MNFQRLFIRLLEKISKKVLIRDSVQSDRPVYMIRYIVFKNRWLSLYIHRFLRSDLDTHHDHPWNFFTFVLSKGYTEELMEPKGGKGLLAPRIVRRKPLSLAYRKATAVHRVILDRNYTEEEQFEAPLTVCLMFKRQRVWGFVQPYNEWSEQKPYELRGYCWINWMDYLAIDPDDPRHHGSE